MIRGRHQLVAAAVDTLQTWLPVTLLAAADDFGWDVEDPTVLAKLTVRGWRQPTDREMFDPAIPLIVTTSTGTVDTPEFTGHGPVHAVYDLTVNPVVRGASFEDTADLVSIYAAAVRACLEQHRSLGVGWVSDLWWVAETFDAPEPDRQRIYAEALVTFHVVVEAVHDRNDRPTVDGWQTPYTVLTTDVTLDHMEP